MTLWRRNSRKITTYLNEPENINVQLQQLVEWLETNPDINACKDLNNLLIFLKTCKYDLERTKKKIKSFYYMRSERTEWFENRDPFLPELQEILRLGVFLPIDGVDEENRKIVIIRTAAHDPKEHSQNDVFKVSKMILDLLLFMEPDSCINGIVAIFDMTGVQLGHARQLNPKLIKRAVESWQAYPCQPKLLEFINAPTHVNLVLNTFRMFMTPKMKSRVSVRRQNSAVKYELLPKDIGGKGPTYKELTTKWEHLVQTNTEFYRNYDQYKSIIKD